jgi:hypothetical protein
MWFCIRFSFWVMLMHIVACSFACAQQPDTISRFSLPVELDSFVVASGFDVNAFITRVRTDTTFYKSFKSLHLVGYTAENEFRAFDKEGTTTASMHSRTRQIREGKCRTTKVLEEHTTGDYYDRHHDYNYYTARLFAFLFFTDTPRCNENDIVAGSLDVHGTGKLEKSAWEMKQLIFNPGSPVSGVPFAGRKAALFDAGESEKYTFKISREVFDGVPCFVFRITPRPGYERRVIYNELTTWFRQSDYTIVARDYSLSYSTLVYDFDVTMKVRTRQIGDKLFPTSLSYDGNWHILTRRRERVKFNVAIAY